MSLDFKTWTEVIEFITEASQLLKEAEGEGKKLYKRAVKILKKLGVKI